MLVLKKYDKLIFKILLSLVFVLAIFFRFKAYLFDTCLWYDEAALSLNILDKSFLELLFKPLTYTQSASSIFMAGTKVLVTLFGDNELVYRFLPFVFGLLAIPLFYAVSAKFLTNKWMILIVNLLFAINFNIICYSAMFKPYSLDLLLFLLGVYLIDKIDFSNKKHLVLFSLALVVFPLLSISSLFLILAFNISVLIYKKLKFSKLVLLNIPFLIIFSIYYYFILIPEREEMSAYWAPYWNTKFISFSYNDILLLKDNLDFSFFPNSTTLFILILLLIGWVYFVKQNKFLNTCVFLVFLLGLILSALQIYPLFQRMFLFYVPAVLIVFACPFDKLKRFWVSLLILMITLYGYNFNYIKNLNNGSLYESFDVKASLEELYNMLKPEDRAYFYLTSLFDFEYYKRKVEDPNRFLYVSLSKKDKQSIFKELDKMYSSSKGDMYILVESCMVNKNEYAYFSEWVNLHKYENIKTFSFNDKRYFWQSSIERAKFPNVKKYIYLIKIVK